MKLMGKIETAFTVAVLAAGMMTLTMCGLDSPATPETPSDGSGTEEPVPEKNDTVYVTGIEYPSDYDWGKDAEYGTVACSLFVEKAGKRIVEVPVGYYYETASDPDMHRCVDGHLYTDYSTDTETVIKKDGRTLFRYPGREMLSSFHVVGEDVYTVGTSRSGSDGFVFRKNGEAVIEIPDGKILSGIHEDNGTVCLAFRSDEWFEYEGDTKDAGYYVYQDGDLDAFVDRAVVRDVLAARMVSGEMCYVALKGSQTAEYVLSAGGVSRSLGVKDYGSLLTCSIEPGRSDIFVKGLCGGSGSKSLCHVVWRSSGAVAYALEAGTVPYYTIVSGEEIYDFVMPQSSFSEMQCYRNGSLYRSYGRDMAFLGSVPAVVSRGALYFIFSDKTDRRVPYLAFDGNIRPASFNGYYTSVTAW